MLKPVRRVSIILFDGFELLDVFGPVELFSFVSEISIDYAGPTATGVRSSQGARVIAELAYSELTDPDIVLVPGGAGARSLVQDVKFLHWLGAVANSSTLVTSVCTGSALLAASGVLDGYRATSNKAAFDWVRECGPNVDWVPKARWVVDRNRWTSSGVAAGMDMACALIGELFGTDVSENAVRRAEYEPHRNSATDPFAKVYGLGR